MEAGPDGRPGETPLTGFDPRYAAIDFSFKAGCPSDEDCAAEIEDEFSHQLAVVATHILAQSVDVVVVPPKVLQ